jgi:serine/threonine protein kinase
MRGPPPFVRFCSKTVCEIRSMVDDTQGGTSARHASFETLSLIGSGKFGKVSACADKRCYVSRQHLCYGRCFWFEIAATDAIMFPNAYLRLPCHGSSWNCLSTRFVTVPAALAEMSADRTSWQIKALAQLDHPYVVKYFDSFVSPQGMLEIIMEFAPNGNLRQKVVGCHEVRPISRQLLLRRWIGIGVESGSGEQRYGYRPACAWARGSCGSTRSS